MSPNLAAIRGYQRTFAPLDMMQREISPPLSFVLQKGLTYIRFLSTTIPSQTSVGFPRKRIPGPEVAPKSVIASDVPESLKEQLLPHHAHGPGLTRSKTPTYFNEVRALRE